MPSVTPHFSTSIPAHDGEHRTYINPEAAASGYFTSARRVIFVNGIKNSGADHRDSALALSMLQMCVVEGFYNLTSGLVVDLGQCLGDKFQLNGSLYDRLKRIAIGNGVTEVRKALDRNPCQTAMFSFLRAPANRRLEIFAHSQGNLIVSNVLEAISMVDGPDAIRGWRVNTFGSPTMFWPKGLIIQEYGFTFDMVSMVAGPNVHTPISKLGRPSGAHWPFAHGFDSYMRDDPAFVINRFRTGGWRLTFEFDTVGLADCLGGLESNLPRVERVFSLLMRDYPQHVGKVAHLYISTLKRSHAANLRLLATNAALKSTLMRALNSGSGSPDWKSDLELLQTLR